MKDSESNRKKLKIDYNRILVAKKTTNVFNCILISITKRLKAFSVYIKYKETDFSSDSSMNKYSFVVYSIEEANEMSLKIEAYFIHYGFSKLEDFNGPKFKIRSSLGDELSRGWKKSQCDKANFLFNEYQMDSVSRIKSYFNIEYGLTDLEYKASIRAISYEGFAKTQLCIFNAEMDILITNDIYWEAICVNNDEYEDEFDLNVSYAIDKFSSSEYIEVFDKFGFKQELNKNRFKIELLIS